MIYKSDTTLTVDSFREYCKTMLGNYYYAGIPDLAEKRLEAEYIFAAETKTEEDLVLYHELSMAAKRSGHILQTDGTSISSFLVFLLGESRVNPLQAHYYCPNCGKYELVETVKFGLDLPEKDCPDCGVAMRRDGFNIPVETVWRTGRRKGLPLEYRCSEGFFPFGFQTIKDFYEKKGQVVLPSGSINGDSETRALTPIAAAVLPEGKNEKDFLQFVAYLADGTLCITGDLYDLERSGIRKIYLMTGNVADAVYKAQNQFGRFASEYSQEDFLTVTARDITNTGMVTSEECIALQLEAPSYYEMSAALTMPHNTFIPEEDNLDCLDVEKLPAFKERPLYCREDVFEYLIAAGVPKEDAKRMAEKISRGAGRRYLEKLKQLGENDLHELVQNFEIHLFPRGSGVQRLITLMTLALYLKDDPICYAKAVWR